MPRFSPCTIADLQLQRIGACTYSFVIQSAGETQHQQAKLRRWGLAILLSAPTLAVREGLQVGTTLVLRQPPQLTQDYIWKYTTAGCVSGITVDSDPGQRRVVALSQDSDGIYWSIERTTLKISGRLPTVSGSDSARKQEGSYSVRIRSSTGFHGACPTLSQISMSYWH